jgi:hypothetical protein
VYKFLAVLIAAAQLGWPANAFGHVGDPKHGGIMNTGGDISFELVAEKAGSRSTSRITTSR